MKNSKISDHTLLLTMIGGIYLSLCALRIPREGELSPLFFNGLVLCRSLAVASAPYNAVGSDIRPLKSG